MPPVKRAKREIIGDSEDESTPPPAKKQARKASAPKLVGKAPSPGVKKTEREGETSSTLDGLKVVITGVTQSIGREALEHKLKEAGASLTSAVSGVTNILICGNVLEDGRPYTEGSKYKKAMEIIQTGKSKAGLEVLNEADFFNKFAALKPPPLDRVPITISTSSTHFMWAEKWRPRTSSDFAFNSEAFGSLQSWLKSWSSSKEEERGALLCGPPGIGKTSACLALADVAGYKLTEFNASDTRGKKQLSNLQALITGGNSLSKGEVMDKLLILMDEADGLSAGDRGGAQELVRMIKLSRVPIVCTCNDKQHPKVRTISKYCRVINFQKPDKPSAVQRVLQIAKQEGFTIKESFVNPLYDAASGDMRQLLNAVQMALLGRSKILSEPSLERFILKDAHASDDSFTGVKKLFASTDMTNRDRLNIFFRDYDLVPLIIEENYLRILSGQKNSNPGSMDQAFRVADSISYSEILNSKIRSSGQWDLLPDVGYFSCVLPTTIVHGFQYHQQFPGVLGRISSTNKHKRQLAELGFRTGHAGRRLVADGYFELLGDVLVQPLTESSLPPVDRIEVFMEGLDKYHLTKNMLVEHLMETRLLKVETKIKSQLTRMANALIVPGEVVSQHRSKRAGSGAATKKASAKSKKRTVASSSTSATLLSPANPGELSDSENVDDDLAKEQEEEERRMGGIF